jgi:hypothetical protein
MTLIVGQTYKRGQPRTLRIPLKSSRVLIWTTLMFPLITGMFVAVVLVLLGQRRAAGYALLAGLAGLLLHRLASVG